MATFDPALLLRICNGAQISQLVVGVYVLINFIVTYQIQGGML